VYSILQLRLRGSYTGYNVVAIMWQSVVRRLWDYKHVCPSAVLFCHAQLWSFHMYTVIY